MSGVPAGSVGLGTFESDIISDDVGIKSALQELETSLSLLQTSTTANNYKWSNANDDSISAGYVTTNATNWANATVVYIHRRARHNVDMRNMLENMFILGAKMFIQRPDIGDKFFSAYVSGAPTITGTDTNQVYAYPVSNVTTVGQVTSQGMKVNLGVFIDTNTYQVGLATAGLASIAYVDNLVAISTAGLGTGSSSIPTLEQVTGAGNVTADSIEADSFVKTGGTFGEFLKADGSLDGSIYATEDLISVGYLETIGIASIAYVDQEIAGVGGGNTANVRTNSLTVSGISTFDSPIQTNSGIIRPANPGVSLQLNANDNTKLIQGVQFAGSAGAVELYGYNSKKLETNLSGVVVSGALSATSFSGDGSGLTKTWTLGANGISDYTFTGIGFTQTTNDPDLYLARGQVYNFSNEMGAHPFQIQDTQNGTVGTPYNNGVTNNGASNGTVRFEVPFNAPDTLYYQCTAHTGMGGTIFIYPTLR